MIESFTGPDGTDYDLAHLAPFTFEFRLKRSDGDVVVPIYVVFSNHTYSRDPAESDDPAWYLPKTSGDSDRYFLHERWEFSRQLPELVKQLLSSARSPCRILNKRNSYLRIERDGLNQFVGWYLFFDLERRTGARNLRLTFRSVHHRDALPGNDLGKDPVPIWKLIDSMVPKNKTPA